MWTQLPIITIRFQISWFLVHLLQKHVMFFTFPQATLLNFTQAWPSRLRAGKSAPIDHKCPAEKRKHRLIWLVHGSIYNMNIHEANSTTLSPSLHEICPDSKMNQKNFEIKFQAFKIVTYCESVWLHKLGSWSPQLAQDVKCSRGYKHPLAMSQAVLDNVVPVGNTCFLYQALTWVFFLKTYTQTLKKKLQIRGYIQKQNKKLKPL